MTNAMPDPDDPVNRSHPEPFERSSTANESEDDLEAAACELTAATEAVEATGFVVQLDSRRTEWFTELTASAARLLRGHQLGGLRR
ncbi:hypothetical protein [Nocardia wallacei]|uniref:hypothetical protein n=1 Tax=Nocardia wallacei TaxID=480035 RepID=UPI002456F1AE|nr:hypothetical protein [Nocardia wallacei]